MHGDVAECFWPGVHESDLGSLDERATAVARGAHRRGAAESATSARSSCATDEVVLCRFQGAPDAVRRAAERAGIPFQRILETGRSPWPLAASS